MNWFWWFLGYVALTTIVRAFRPNPFAEILSFLLFIIPIIALVVWLLICTCRFIAALVHGSGR
ncbi:MAG: hypothetical protein IJG25_04360 [Thermoguttaceae bacterium]|nr:hypothetical protein [Thermoguttaceae bacterium]